MADNQTVDGLDLLLKKLDVLDKKAAGKVLSTVIRAQLNVIGKQMKADVDSKVKEGRKGVRSRFKNNAKKNWVLAKVGFGVGKKKDAKPRKTRRTSRGGVGIGVQNIHWWVAGTDQRFTGTYKGHKGTYKTRGRAVMNRGKMPSFQPGLAKIAAAKSRGQQNAEMIKRGALALQKEVTKIQKMR